MARIDFDEQLDPNMGDVEELYGGTLDDDDREGRREHFDELKKFYARASADGLSVVKWL